MWERTSIYSFICEWSIIFTLPLKTLLNSQPQINPWFWTCFSCHTDSNCTIITQIFWIWEDTMIIDQADLFLVQRTTPKKCVDLLLQLENNNNKLSNDI